MSVVVVFTPNSSDVIADTINLERSHYRPTRILQGQGFDSSTGLPIFSQYTSEAPSAGTQSITIARLIASSQTTLNQRTGQRGAIADMMYVRANSEQTFMERLRLRFPLKYRGVFEFYQQWVAISGLSNNQRGVVISNWRYIVENVNLSIENGYGYCDVTFLPETAGLPAQTYTLPTETPFPPYTLPQLVIPPFGIVFPETSTDGLMNNISLSNAVAGGLAGGTSNGDDPAGAHPSLNGLPVLGGTPAIEDGLCYGISLYVKSLCHLKKCYTQWKNALTVDPVFATYLDGGTGFEASLSAVYTAGQIITAMDDTDAKNAIICAYRVATIGTAIEDIRAQWQDALTGFTPANTNETILKTFFVDMTLPVDGKTNPNFSFYMYCLGTGIAQSLAGDPVVGCPCYDWCLYADMAINNMGFTATASSGTPTYVFADGAWREGASFTQAGDTKKGVKIEITIPSSDLVGMIISFDCTFSNLTQNINNQINLFTGGSGGVNTVNFTEEEQAGTDLSMSWSGEGLAIDFMALTILCGGRAGGGAITGGTVYLRSVTMFGTGVAPTIAGWTPC